MLLHKSSQSLPFDLAKRRHPLGIFSYSMWPRDCHVPRSKCLLPYNLMQVPVYMTKSTVWVMLQRKPCLQCHKDSTSRSLSSLMLLSQTWKLKGPQDWVMAALFAFMPEGQTKGFWHELLVRVHLKTKLGLESSSSWQDVVSNVSLWLRHARFSQVSKASSRDRPKHSWCFSLANCRNQNGRIT